MNLICVLLAISWASGCRQSTTPSNNQESSSLLAEAKRHLDDGDGEKASELVRQVLVEQPEHIKARTLLAKVEASQGNLDSAVNILDEIAAASPNHQASASTLAANMLSDAGDLLGAVNRHQQILDVRPNHVGSRRAAAKICNRLGMRFDANEHVRALLSLAPVELADLYRLLDPTEVDHESAAAPSLAKAIQLMQENRFPAAIKEIEKNPLAEYPAAMCLKGLAISQIGDAQQFALWYSQREPIWERYPDHWIAVGNWLSRAGDHQQAATAYGFAVDREPFHRMALQRLGQSLAAIENDELAKRVTERAALVKDLVELAGDVLRSPERSPQPYGILSSELVGAGATLQAFAWEFNGVAIFQASEATKNNHATGLSQLIESLDSSSERSRLLCGFVPSNQKPELELNIEHPTEGSIDRKASPPRTNVQPDFWDVANSVGLEFQYRNADPVVEKHFLLHQALGAGIACCDYDLDGRVDVYAAQGGCNPPAANSTFPNQLFRNTGQRFDEVTASSGSGDRGYSMGVTSGDWNQDGLPDLVVGNMSTNSLLINQGDGTFVKVKLDGDWQKETYTTGLAIADINGDHLPELTEVNYVEDPAIFDPIQFFPDGSPRRLPGPNQFPAAADRIFVNTGDGKVQTTMTTESANAERAMGLLIGNLDRSPGNELFVTNDQGVNQLWIGVPARDAAAIKGVAVGVSGLPLASMGIAAADFDGNGFPDLHVTNFDDELSNHYLQRRDLTFDDRIVAVGLDQQSQGFLGFGTQSIDFDNNGVPDLCVGNGHIEDFRPKFEFAMPTQFFVADGEAFQRTDFADGDSYWKQNHLSRAMVKLDWNRDGRVDLIVGDLLQPLALLENRSTNTGHWTQVQLVGTVCERDAVGASLELRCGEFTTHHFVFTGDGYMCKNQSLLFAGVGSNESVDEMLVRWPNGREQRWSNVKVDQQILLIEGQDSLHQH